MLAHPQGLSIVTTYDARPPASQEIRVRDLLTGRCEAISPASPLRLLPEQARSRRATCPVNGFSHRAGQSCIVPWPPAQQILHVTDYLAC
jgi:hypothetical protein